MTDKENSRIIVNDYIDITDCPELDKQYLPTLICKTLSDAGEEPYCSNCHCIYKYRKMKEYVEQLKQKLERHESCKIGDYENLQQKNDELELENKNLNISINGWVFKAGVAEGKSSRYRDTIKRIKTHCELQNLKYDTTACEVLQIIEKLGSDVDDK